MNVIDYSPFRFDDSVIVGGSVAMENSLMFDSLKPDELSVEVVSNDTGKRKLLTVDLEWYSTTDGRGYVLMTNDIRQFTYGDPVYYYYNGVLQGKYYIRSVDRLSENHFRLSAYSAVGLWAGIQHFGGIYDGETAGTVIADLLAGFTYSIDNDVASVPLYGYLPIASVRDNLQQVLFAVGASLLKDANGNPRFRFLQNVATIPVGDDRIFIGGKLNYKTPATSVRVTEHSYYVSTYDVEVSLFDNTDGSGTADNKLVTFDEPCHNLVATGLTLGANGANYAYVTGTGTLTGKKYTHTTRIFAVQTGANGEPNEAKIEKATLVSPVNSANVAARVSDYKATAEEVACGIVMATDDVKPASKVAFNDPYGEATEGFVATMNITMSGKSKADCTIIKNYTPSHFGNNFNNVLLVTSNTTWTPPAGTSLVRLVLGQGGQAGQNGYNGANAVTQTWSFDFSATAGVGGAGGAAGEAGKVFVTDISSPSAITFSIGAGGTIGSGEGATGNAGGHTTATMNGGVYSSENGAIIDEGYVDIFSGTVYAVSGIDGVNGGNGGGSNRQKGNGEDVTYNSTTWTGGRYSTQDYQTSNPNYERYSYGGSGGGAAYGSNGADGTGATGSYTTDQAGAGGDGGDASVLSYTPTLGSGGAGGCGGGGGGVPGYRNYEEGDGTMRRGWGSVGHGGDYSNATNGGAGFALIYY